MSRVLYSAVLIALVFCLYCNVAHTQTTQTPTGPQNCSAVQNMAITISDFSGTWYEVARSPAAADISCVKVAVGLMTDQTTLSVNTTYSNTANSYYMNQQDSYKVLLNAANDVYGYNVTFTKPGTTTGQMTTFKVLNTDYVNYALVCGYTNPLDNTTSFGMILTRTQLVTLANLQSYENTAMLSYLNFKSGTVANVTQSTQCTTTNGASTNLPILTALIVAFLAIIKFF